MVEANQSGLIAEPLVDITPRLPVQESKFGPLHSSCEEEGLVVCDRGHLVGERGVSMDEVFELYIS